jgi:hypothetical protein
MKSKVVQLIIIAALVCLVSIVAWLVASGPRNPIALLRVVDPSGKPIAAAVVQPEGLRTKPGPYVSGWYSWRTGQNKVPDSPAMTDSEGYARLPYPKYVFERIETGTLCLSVEHPDYVPARPECRVTIAPPTGAPWRVWIDYLTDRIRRKELIAPTAPIVLQKGAVLKLSLKPGSGSPHGSFLTAQVSDLAADTGNFWTRPAAGLLMTRRLRPGPSAVRVVQFDPGGSIWFGAVTSITAVAGQTNEIMVELKPGLSVRGLLDQTVARPVHDGRIIAHVWPKNEDVSSSPPQWHTWTNIQPDGSFELHSLPEGDLELVAICDGFVSTNGPGKFHFHYPQKYSLEGSDLNVVLRMEPTACLEVTVQNDQGKPLPDAQVSTWPNVRYGEWAATVIGEDCYNTVDLLNSAGKDSPNRRVLFRPVHFMATTDLSGWAIIRNIPCEADVFTVEHPRYVLPAADTGFGQKRRQSAMVLHPGQTNSVTVQLEPATQSPITHY